MSIKDSIKRIATERSTEDDTLTVYVLASAGVEVM